MFVQLFKSNSASAFIFIPLIAIAMWTTGFIHPLETPLLKHAMPLYVLVAKPFTNSYISISIALIFVLAEAFILNYIINEHEVLRKKSYLPALFYVISMSSNKAMFMLHPLIFSNFFLLFAFNRLLDSYRKERAFSHFFDAGFLVSIATLFYFPYIVFFPVLAASLVILRPFNWREWVIATVGIILPYILAASFYFLYNQLDYLIYDKMFFPFTKHLHQEALSRSFYFSSSIQWAILILAIASLFTGMGNVQQKTKKAIVIAIWLFLAAVASIGFVRDVSTSCFAALALPVSIFYAHYFMNLKRYWVAEILFTLFLGSMLVHLFINTNT